MIFPSGVGALKKAFRCVPSFVQKADSPSSFFSASKDVYKRQQEGVVKEREAQILKDARLCIDVGGYVDLERAKPVYDLSLIHI